MIAREAVLLLRSKILTLSAAESCTGGMISKKITDIPGASTCFLASCITYSNNSKVQLLGVCERTLLQYGAVSLETASEMASGIRSTINSDIGLSVTGIAGPDGGTELKPVGTVCFGIDYSGKITVKKELFEGDRNQIRDQASDYALQFLIDTIY